MVMWEWIQDVAYRFARRTRVLVFAVAWPDLYALGWTDGACDAHRQARRLERAQSHEKGRLLGYRARYRDARRELKTLRLAASQPAAVSAGYAARHALERTA